MRRNLRDLINQHVNQWFRRVGNDEWSPALTIKEFSDRFLEYLKWKKLSLACRESEFRKNMCEFICTAYVAKKQDTTWTGPLSEPMRPSGWTQRHENEWEEYLSIYVFTDEVWAGFWSYIPETLWESRVPDWRFQIQMIVFHYVQVNPSKIESFVEDAGSIPSDEEEETKRGYGSKRTYESKRENE